MTRVQSVSLFSRVFHCGGCNHEWYFHVWPCWRKLKEAVFGA